MNPTRQLKAQLYKKYQLQFVGVLLTVRYRNQKDPRANPSAFL